MRTIIHTMGPHRKQHGLTQNVVFQDFWETKPKTQNSWASVSLSLSLSLSLCLSLSLYDMLSKFANGLDPEDCWYAGYIHIPQERIFNPCIRTCSMFRSKLKWIFKLITCDKGSDEPAQMCILNTTWHTSQPAHKVGLPSALQRNAIQTAVRWWAGGGPLWIKLGSRCQASLVVC